MTARPSLQTPGPTPRPIFVIGFQRSGTTLLQALLGAHPRIAAPPELHFIFRILGLADYYGDLHDDTNLRSALHDMLHPPVPLLAGCGFDEEVLFRRALAGDRTYRGLLELVMDDFAERQGKPRWSEKTPGQSAQSVLELCPEAQLIHIIRDPRDVVASSLVTPWASAPARQVAVDWRAFTLNNIRVGAESGPGSYLQIRFEDLVRGPEVVLRIVTAFLGEDFTTEMLTDHTARRPTVAAVAAGWQGRALEPIDSTREGQWQTRLTRLQKAEVAAVVQNELLAFGYQPTGLRQTAVGALVSRVASLGTLPHRLRMGGRPGRATPQQRYRQAQQHMQSVAGSVEASAAGAASSAN